MSQAAAFIAEQLQALGVHPLRGARCRRWRQPPKRPPRRCTSSACARSARTSSDRSCSTRASAACTCGRAMDAASWSRCTALRPRWPTCFDTNRASNPPRPQLPMPRAAGGPHAARSGNRGGGVAADRGEPADAHDAEIRRALQQTLVRPVERGRGLTGLDGLRHGLMVRREGHLWPRPHDRRFDFEATKRGAEWIDAFATKARRILDSVGGGEGVVGHTDWRVGNMR